MGGKELVGCWLHSRDFCKAAGKEKSVTRLCSACGELFDLAAVSRVGFVKRLELRARRQVTGLGAEAQERQQQQKRLHSASRHTRDASA